MKATQLKSKLLIYVWLAFEIILSSNLALVAAPQTIYWTGTTNTILNQNVAYPIGATSSSGLTVTLRVEHGPAVLANGEIIVTNIGTVVVAAEQAGDAAFSPATAERRFNARQVVLNPVGWYGSYGPFEIAANYAYFGSGFKGFEVVDLSNQANPLRIGINTNGYIQDVAVSGHYVYLADLFTGLRVMDVLDPANPIQVGEYELSGGAFGVSLMGHYVLLENHSGLQVIDVIDPLKPNWVGKYEGLAFDSNRMPREIRFEGTYAYMVDYNEGIQIVDFGDPATPTMVGGYHTGRYPRNLERVGKYAYVMDVSDTIKIVDVSNPNIPLLAGTYELDTSNPNWVQLGGYAVEMQTAGDYGYVAERYAGVEVLDLSKPVNPVGVGRDSGSREYVGTMQVIGDYLYTGGAGFHVLKITKGYTNIINPQPPESIALTNGFIPLPQISSSGVAVEYSVLSGPAKIEADQLVLTGTGLVTLAAKQTNDGVFMPLKSEWLIDVRRVSQSITWEGTGLNVLTFNTAYPLSATSSSGLPIIMRVEGGPAVWEEGKLTISGTGWVRVTAVQEGDEGHWPATETRDFNVKQGWVEDGDIGLNNGGEAWDVEVVGEYFYVASSFGGLEILKRTDSSAPVRVGALGAGNGTAMGVAVKGHYAYLANSGAGLRVIDIADPAHPVEVGAYDTEGSAQDVQVVGSYAYIADGDAGLQILDVSDPAKPDWVGGYDTIGYCSRLRVAGGHAYLADGYYGSEVIDVSDPTTPFSVGGDLTTASLDVSLVGDYAYVWGAKLRILDVTNPANPARADQDNAPYKGGAISGDSIGNYAFIVDAQSRSVILDLSNPTLPIAVGGPEFYGVNRVQVFNNSFYATTSRGVAIFNLIIGYPNALSFTPPSTVPITRRFINLPLTSSSGKTVNYSVVSGPAEVQGDKLVFNGEGRVIFRADQSQVDGYLPISAQWSINIERLPQTISFQGVYYDELPWPLPFPHSGQSGLGSGPQDTLGLNTSYPLSAIASSGLPVELRVTSGPAVLLNGTITVTNLGTVVVTADQPGNGDYLPASVTHLFNVRQASLTRVGSFGSGCCALSIQIVGDLAYVGGPDGGVQIWDLSDPVNPFKRGAYITTGYAWPVEISGSRAYIVNSIAGLEIVDVSNPANPVKIGSYQAGTGISGIAVSANHAYLAKGQAGLEIINFEDPSNPIKVGEVYTNGWTFDVKAVDHFVYVSRGTDGLQILDVSDPAHPLSVGAFGTGGSLLCPIVIYPYAYTLDGIKGFQIVDVADPKNPTLVGSHASSVYTSALAVAGKYACLENALTYALELINLDDPAMPMLMASIQVGSYIQGVAFHGTNVYVIDGGGSLRVFGFHVADPQALSRLMSAGVLMGKMPVSAVGFAHSGLPVKITVVSGPAVVDNGEVSFTGLGPVVLRAEQAGNDAYLPATAEWSVTVSTVPELGVQLFESYVGLFWVTQLEGVKLQVTESLSPGNRWADVIEKPDNWYWGASSLYLKQDATQKFYRLVKP